MRPLYEFTAEEMLSQLAERQAGLIEAEAEEARAKAKFEAIQGAVMETLRTAGSSVEIAKKSMWGDPMLKAAHDEYLEALIKFKSARAAEHRADRALQLWQTVRADVRRV